MAVALRRYQALGDQGIDVLSGLNASTCSSSNTTALQAFASGGAIGGLDGQRQPNSVFTHIAIFHVAGDGNCPIVTPAPTSQSSGSPLIIILIILLALTVAVGIAAYYLFVVRNRQGVGGMVSSAKLEEEPSSMEEEQTDYAAQGQETPIAQFMTTYMLGDDLYDDSFSMMRHRVSFWASAAWASRKRSAWVIPKKSRRSKSGYSTRTISRPSPRC